MLKRHEKLVERHEAVKARLQETVDEIASRAVKRTRIEAFLEELKAQPNLLQTFDEKLWRATIERLIVNRESDVVVEFKDGRQIRVSVIGQ